MRLLSVLPASSNAAQQGLPLVSAWLQHLLSTSCRSMHTGSAALQEQQQQQSPSATTLGAPEAGAEQQQQQQPASQPSWKTASRRFFSIRPSALSPLHPLHREIVDVDQRLDLLGVTLQAHLKLAEELHPKELQACEDAPDPVAAALAARRAALQAVVDSASALLAYRVGVCDSSAPADMRGYYGLLEGLLRAKDPDVKEFKEVLEGNRSVWDYWFQHFTPQYSGLPGLGSLERIYNQVDEEVMLQQLARLRAVTPKPLPMPQVDRWGRAKAVGGRKTSTAQVYLWRGQGRVLVNRKPLDAYFGDVLMRSHVLRPLQVAGLVDKVDVLVHVKGGGVSGQAQAAGHGIAKALRRLDPELKRPLRAAGLLKRDPRAVERKKFGRAKARKRFAWVKR